MGTEKEGFYFGGFCWRLFALCGWFLFGGCFCRFGLGFFFWLVLSVSSIPVLCHVKIYLIMCSLCDVQKLIKTPGRVPNTLNTRVEERLNHP